MSGWIERLVNTSGMMCPVFQKTCPGHRRGDDGCCRWITETVINGQQTEAIEGCMDAWTYVQIHNVSLELIRTQAGIDKSATIVGHAAKTVGSFMKMVVAAQELPPAPPAKALTE